MMVIEQNTSGDLKFKMAVMPIYCKNIQTTFLQNNWADLEDILHETYGAFPCIK